MRTENSVEIVARLRSPQEKTEKMEGLVHTPL
jgi:hypothetical protein